MREDTVNLEATELKDFLDCRMPINFNFIGSTKDREKNETYEVVEECAESKVMRGDRLLPAGGGAGRWLNSA